MIIINHRGIEDFFLFEKEVLEEFLKGMEWVCQFDNIHSIYS